MSYDVNGQKFTLQTGEGVFVNSRRFHYGFSDAHRECFFLCILLSPKLLSVNPYLTENYLNPLIQNPHFSCRKLSPANRWQNFILRDLESLYGNNLDRIQPFTVLEKFSHILQLLFENMDLSPEQDKNSEDILALTAMIGYVQKNYPDKILLKDISAAGNCCKTKCTSLFQTYLSTSPMLYLSHYRLEKSVFLLRNTTMSITEIAYACGFSNTSYFCELFRKNYNISPGNYQKQSRRF